MSKAQNPPKNQFVPEKKAESPPLEHIVTRSQKSETFYRIAGFEDLPENLPRVDAKQGIEPEFETFDRLQETIKLGQAIDEQIIEKLKRLSVSCEADDISDGDSNAEQTETLAPLVWRSQKLFKIETPRDWRKWGRK